MSILKVNTIQPFSGTSVKITGQSVISGSFSGSFEGNFDGTVEYADITDKPTLISGSNQLAGTSVNGGLTVNTALGILSASLEYNQNIDVDSGTEVIAAVATGSAQSAFFDYVIAESGNVRAGTLMAAWTGISITYAETSTQDIGDTSDVDLSAHINAGNVELKATTTTNNWSIKTVSKLI